ncbi:HdeD family acid-resistance protein [Georgenia yuyongxinii]|uniref:HdeD family acid-resistance protein n=2 Tax=Georgenia yuyongxinii TaxID=2589797 RepID=A0A552WN30_9MICO|nr:HdeD family acid-resistance protein [Georgenia yuyongxinii]
MPRPPRRGVTEEEDMKMESTYDPGPALRAGELIFARVWKLIALRGLVAIAFGIVLLVWPDVGLTAIVSAVGVLAIASGSVSAAAAFGLPGAAKRYRFWLAVHAVVGLLAGAVVLLWPDLSATALLYAIALWAIAVGVIELVGAFVLPLSGPRTVLVAAGGIAFAAFGVVMFVEPSGGAMALVALVAAVALVRGTFDVALAILLRHVVGELDQLFRSPSGVEAATHG